MTTDPASLDLKSPANARDPFPVFARLRDADPIHWSNSLSGWVVTRYADVLRVFDEPETFSSDRFRRLDPRYASTRPEVLAVGRVLGEWLVFRDAPDHTRQWLPIPPLWTRLDARRSRVTSKPPPLSTVVCGLIQNSFLRKVDTLNAETRLPSSVTSMLRQIAFTKTRMFGARSSAFR